MTGIMFIIGSVIHVHFMFLVLLAKPFWFFSTLWFESWTSWKICCIESIAAVEALAMDGLVCVWSFLLGHPAPMFCVVFDSAGILKELLWNYRKMLVTSKMDKYVFWNLVCSFCLIWKPQRGTTAHTHAHTHHLKITEIKMTVKRHEPIRMNSK